MKNFTDDTVVAVASFLSPHDMLNLALTCKRFGAKNGTTATKQPADRGERSREVRQKTESVSLMEVQHVRRLMPQRRKMKRRLYQDAKTSHGLVHTKSF